MECISLGRSGSWLHTAQDPREHTRFAEGPVRFAMLSDTEIGYNVPEWDKLEDEMQMARAPAMANDPTLGEKGKEHREHKEHTEHPGRTMLVA